MDEYIDRQAAISILNAKSDMALGTPKQCFAAAAAMLEKLPAADVVEVVRCKDCKYWKCYGGQYADDGECWHLGELDCCMHKDDYCSKGRRKMDKEE